MNVNYAKFQKSLIVDQFQGNYLNITKLMFENIAAVTKQKKCTKLVNTFVLFRILCVKPLEVEKEKISGPPLPRPFHFQFL